MSKFTNLFQFDLMDYLYFWVHVFVECISVFIKPNFYHFHIFYQFLSFPHLYIGPCTHAYLGFHSEQFLRMGYSQLALQPTRPVIISHFYLIIILQNRKTLVYKKYICILHIFIFDNVYYFIFYVLLPIIISDRLCILRTVCYLFICFGYVIIFRQHLEQN